MSVCVRARADACEIHNFDDETSKWNVPSQPNNGLSKGLFGIYCTFGSSGGRYTKQIYRCHAVFRRCTFIDGEREKKKEEEERMNKRGREKQAYARVTVVPKYLQRFLILIPILVCNWFSIRNITVCFSLPFSLFFSGWDWSYNGGNSNNNIYVKKRWRHTIHMHTHSNRKRKTKSKIESCAIIELFLNKINRARDQIRLLPQYIYNTIIGISSNSSSYSIRQRFNALKSSAAYQFRNTKTHSHTPRKRKRRKVKRRVNSLSLYLALFWHAGQ